MLVATLFLKGVAYRLDKFFLVIVVFNHFPRFFELVYDFINCLKRLIEAGET